MDTETTNLERNKKFTQFFTKSLNPEQQEAVSQKDGVLLICAGAGSGKTRVITARITHLVLSHSVPPESIIALTFTNKAAREMKERIISFLGDTSVVPYVGTFHAYCLRILKTHNHLLTTPDFSILDEADQEKMVRTLIQRYALQKRITARQVISLVSRLKNDAISACVDENQLQDPLMRQIYRAYEQEKNLSHCLDFDDLLLETLKLFKNSPNFKYAFNQHIRHVLVDEYQDTNHVQHALLKALALTELGDLAINSLCVVGDEDQSIYSWRGATVTNIMNFTGDFPEVRRLTLEHNYRSVQPILDTAHSVIMHNRQRNPKRLWSQRSGSDCVRLLKCTSGYQEAEMLATLAKNPNFGKLSSLAVLYRSHYQSRILEEALIRHSVPYKIIGGIQFYDRLEIKDLLAYLRLIVNPFDRFSFMRAIATPSRGLGEKFQELFMEVWDQHPFLTFIDVAYMLINNKLLPQAKQESLEQFIKLFSSYSRTDNAYNTLESVLRNTQYISHLKTSFDAQEALAKAENVKELTQALRAMQERGVVSIEAFLDEVSLLQDARTHTNDEQEYISLMTLHAAKGLEFDTVMITGLEENVLPSGHAVTVPELLEEERRLFYVGITRARERLLITNARFRSIYGTLTEQKSSRFVKELTLGPVRQDDSSTWQPSHTQQYFNEWLTPAMRKQHDKNTYTPAQAPATWQLQQWVKHEKFGHGLIEKIEQRDTQHVYLTIKFTHGSKKLAGNFVEPA